MIDLTALDRYRQSAKNIWGWAGDGTCGAFAIPSKIDGQPLVVIASSEGDWDHVSVSRRNRCPNWAEMEQIALMFFRPEETAIQFHIPPTDHINTHPNCLHWWRPQQADLPRPPSIFV